MGKGVIAARGSARSDVMVLLTELPAYAALVAHYNEVKDLHMRALFGADPQRFDKFSLRLGDILFDYSKNRVTQHTMALLFDLARRPRSRRGATPCSRGRK
jgi:glucose-6-phosphate isomerase